MIIPTGYAQVNLRFGGSGAPEGAEVTFGVDNTATGLTAEQIGNSVETALLDADVRSVWSDDINLDTILVKKGPNATGASAEVAVNQGGLRSGDADSPNTAILIHKVTEQGGRAGRGRMYWPGVPANLVSVAGILDSEYVSNENTDLANFLTELTEQDIPMVLLHGEGSPISTPTPVISLEIDSKVATQRRRLRR